MTLRNELEPFASSGREAFGIVDNLFAAIVAALRRDQRFAAERVPLSGAIGGAWSGDIDLKLFDRTLKIQVKARREFRTLYQWLNGADLLLLKADRCNPIAVLPIRLFAELAIAAQKVRP